MIAEDANCLACGYSLRGLADPRCPECGRSFDPANPATYSIRGASCKHRPLWQALSVYVAWLLTAYAVSSTTPGTPTEAVFLWIASGPLGWVLAVTGFDARLMVMFPIVLHSLWGVCVLGTNARHWHPMVHAILGLLWYGGGTILSLVLGQVFGVLISGC